MSKKPSDTTLLRRARSEIAQLKRRAMNAESLQKMESQRADRAQSDAAEWKRRFDLLLSRTPTLPPPRDDGEKLQRCVDLLRQNVEENYVPSIKLYRELFGASLVDAKNAMEAERYKLRGSSPNGTG